MAPVAVTFIMVFFLANTTNQIVVTLNYRLSSLGFLVTPNINGNFGLKDQRLALQWVQNNICKFGGNRRSITIFGESAGAMSVSIHLVSPLSAGLFHKAIMESNPITEYQNYSMGLSTGASFAQALGCSPSNLTCLQNVDANTIISNSADSLTMWTPWIGGPQLPDAPLTLFKQGRYNRVPTILGTNGNEAALFLGFTLTTNLSASAYEALVRADFPHLYQQVLALYPSQPNADNRINYGLITTHRTWACPGAQIILAVNQYNPSDKGGYLYYFEHIFSFGALFGSLCAESVCHAEDLFFVWDTVEFVSQGYLSLTAEEAVLSHTLQTYFGRFSATGIPSAPGQVQWPRFVRSSNISLVFDTPASYTSRGYLQKYCNFWDSHSSF